MKLERVGAVLLLVLMLVAGLSWWATPADDVAIEAPAAQLLPIIRAQRAQIEANARARDSLARVATAAGAKYRAAKEELRSRFGVDSLNAVVTVANDTTQLITLVRYSDSTEFAIPLEFVDRVNADLAAAEVAYTSEHQLRVFQDSVVIPGKDSLIHQLDALADARAAEAAHWKKKANPRCGTKCKVLAGAGAGELLRRLLSSWISR